MASGSQHGETFDSAGMSEFLPQCTKKTMAFVLLPDFSITGLSSFAAAMLHVNREVGEDIYTLTYYSMDGEPVLGSNFRYFDVDGSYDNLRTTPDYIVILGGSDVELYEHESLLAWLRYWSRRGVHMVGISSATHALAKAHLLDHRISCTHWSEVGNFRASYPNVHVQRTYYVTDGPVSSCSGGTTAIDLIISIIARDQGEAVATMVSIEFQYEAVRTSTELQRGIRLGGNVRQNDQLDRIIQIIEDTPQHDWTVPEVAAGVGVSPRHLRRMFKESLDMKPSAFILSVRLRLARQKLQTTQDSISDICYDCGFSSPAYFYQCYKRVYKIAPSKDRNWFDLVASKYKEHLKPVPE